MLKLPTLTLITVAGLMISTTTAARAVILNGSFETGFTDWATTGQATVQDGTYLGTTTPAGNFQAFLETLNDTTGVNSSDLETFLGLSAGTLTSSGATEGSAITQEITVNAGDVLKFSWNFLTDDDPLGDADYQYNDFGFFSIAGSPTKLGETTSPMLPSPSFTRLSKATGYQNHSYIIPVAGTYTLGFGVVDVDKINRSDTAVNSALLVDNVQIEPVPEPATILGSLTALAFGAKLKRKFSRPSQPDRTKDRVNT